MKSNINSIKTGDDEGLRKLIKSMSKNTNTSYEKLSLEIQNSINLNKKMINDYRIIIAKTIENKKDMLLLPITLHSLSFNILLFNLDTFLLMCKSLYNYNDKQLIECVNDLKNKINDELFNETIKDIKNKDHKFLNSYDIFNENFKK